MRKSQKKVCVIGPLPPPIHGLSMINQAVVNKITEINNNVIILNTAANSLNRSALNIFSRLIKMIRIIIQYLYLLIFNKVDKLYLSLSGGLGQVYDLVLIFFSKLFKIKIFIHHHSFAYLNKQRRLTRYIINISKNNADHIVLCEQMDKSLKKYIPNLSSRIISNIAFIENQIIDTFKVNNGLTLGFLSNISFEKGIYEYIEIFKNFGTNSNIQGIVAGHFTDAKSKKYLEDNLFGLSNVKYVGAILKKDKSSFFHEIDILIIPSLKEAEPLVILEALSYGVPVIARSIGCIPQMLDSNCGFVVGKEDDFINASYHIVNKLMKNPELLQKLKKQSFEEFNKRKEYSLLHLDIFIKELVT